MADWPRWLVDNPIDLVRYVLPNEVGKYIAIPERSDTTIESRLERLEVVYERIRRPDVIGPGRNEPIHYASDPPTDEQGRRSEARTRSYGPLETEPVSTWLWF